MTDWIIPQTKQSLPSRGLQSSSDIWIREKSQRDSQLWGNDSRLWVFENKLYDLTSYIDRHPGGPNWIRSTQGQDITQHFITHHLNQTHARSVLAKFYVAQAPIQRESRFTFDQNGLFRNIKKRLLSTFTKQQLQNTQKSVINGLQLLTLWLVLSYLSATYESYLIAVLAGTIIYPIIGIAHNFVHRNHPFKYLYLITGFTHEEWERMHCLSHHSYTNTLLDYEAQAFQPIVYYHKVLPKNKFLFGIIKQVIFLLLVPSNILLKLLIVPLTQKKSPELFYMVPLTQIPLLYLISNNLSLSIKIFLTMHITFGFIFSKLAFIGHKTGREWTEGNTEIRDFAEHQIYTSTDIQTPFHSGFLSYLFYAGFNCHAIHHLFPTIDNHQLPQANLILKQQAKKKGVPINQVNGILQGLLQIQQNFYQRKEWKRQSE